MRSNRRLLAIGVLIGCFSILAVGIEDRSSVFSVAADSGLKERIAAPQTVNENGQRLNFVDVHGIPGSVIIFYVDPKTSTYYYLAESKDESLQEKWPDTSRGFTLKSLSQDGGSAWFHVSVNEKTQITAVSYWDGKAWKEAKPAQAQPINPNRPLPPFTQVPEIHPGLCGGKPYVYSYSEWRCSSLGCCLVDIYTCPGFANTIGVPACCDSTLNPSNPTPCQSYGIPLVSGSD